MALWKKRPNKLAFTTASAGFKMPWKVNHINLKISTSDTVGNGSMLDLWVKKSNCDTVQVFQEQFYICSAKVVLAVNLYSIQSRHNPMTGHSWGNQSFWEYETAM